MPKRRDRDEEFAPHEELPQILVRARSQATLAVAAAVGQMPRRVLTPHNAAAGERLRVSIREVSHQIAGRAAAAGASKLARELLASITVSVGDVLGVFALRELQSGGGPLKSGASGGRGNQHRGDSGGAFALGTVGRDEAQGILHVAKAAEHEVIAFKRGGMVSNGEMERALCEIRASEVVSAKLANIKFQRADD